MAKYIDADAYTNAIKQSLHAFDGNPLVQYGLELAVHCVDCVERIVPAADVEPARRWIPCGERLPEVGERVLACWERHGKTSDVSYSHIDILYLTPAGKWYSEFGKPNGKVIAWMPLPEPPKMDGGSE